MHGFYYLTSAFFFPPVPHHLLAPSLQLILLVGWVSPWIWGLISISWGTWGRTPTDGRSSLSLCPILLFPTLLLQKHLPPGNYAPEPGIISSRRLNAGCGICWQADHFCFWSCCCCSAATSRSTLFNLVDWPPRLPSLLPSPGVCSNSYPLSQRYTQTISFSDASFSFCLQYFPASGSFPTSQLFVLGDQSIGVSAEGPPMNIKGWFPLELTALISLLSKGLTRVFSSPTLPPNLRWVKRTQRLGDLL